MLFPDLNYSIILIRCRFKALGLMSSSKGEYVKSWLHLFLSRHAGCPPGVRGRCSPVQWCLPLLYLIRQCGEAGGMLGEKPWDFITPCPAGTGAMMLVWLLCRPVWYPWTVCIFPSGYLASSGQVSFYPGLWAYFERRLALWIRVCVFTLHINPATDRSYLPHILMPSLSFLLIREVFAIPSFLPGYICCCACHVWLNAAVTGCTFRAALAK